MYYIGPSSDPFRKNVSFLTDDADARYLFEQRPERRLNSYQTDYPPVNQHQRYFAPFHEPMMGDLAPPVQPPRQKRSTMMSSDTRFAF